MADEVPGELTGELTETEIGGEYEVTVTGSKTIVDFPESEGLEEEEEEVIPEEEEEVEEQLIETREFGIQAGALDEFAEYFECFLKIGDCLPKIIVCSGDDEMPRIVVCEGLKRKPAVNTTEETKKVLQEIQRQIAEMIHVVQVNAVLREEINHIEGECPVIKLKQVMQRITATAGSPRENEDSKETCPANNQRNSTAYSSNTDIGSNNKAYQFAGESKSAATVSDTFEFTCSMCFTKAQFMSPCGCCDGSAGMETDTCSKPQYPASCRPHGLPDGTEDFTDEAIQIMIDKCLGPSPCNTCPADKFSNIVEDLDMDADFTFAQTGNKIYDIIVPPGHKDQQGWGGNHNIEPSVFPPQQFYCSQGYDSSQRFTETLQELQGELSKLDQLGDVVTGGSNMYRKDGPMTCASASCVTAAHFLNDQIAQMELELNNLRSCLERSRRERQALENQQNLLGCMKPLCFS